MAKKFRNLYDKMSPESHARVEAKVANALKEMPLNELREARHLTQEQLAQQLQQGQAAVSKLERRTDMYVSTLRRFIEAMGGHLDIVARFPDGEIKVSDFSTEPEARPTPERRVVREKAAAGA